MKKLLSPAPALALCLTLGVTATAEGNNTTINQSSTSKTGTTTVSYTVAACEGYTVTIPASVTLTGSTGNLSGTLAIRLYTRDFNVSGKTIAVKLTNSTNSLYLVNKDNADKKFTYTLNASGNTYYVNDTLLSWTYGNSNTDQTLALVAQATTPLGLPAGEYTDTLTFTVSVTNSSVNSNVTVKDWENGSIIDGGEAE